MYGIVAIRDIFGTITFARISYIRKLIQGGLSLSSRDTSTISHRSSMERS